MSYLITGGNGFIGTALASELRALGGYVRIFDIVGSNNSNHDLATKMKLDFENASVTELDKLVLAMRDTDIVIHLAAESDESKFMTCAHDSMITNVCGTLNVLNAAVSAEVKRVIFISSAAVYGEQDPEIAMNENAVKHPNTLYGASKISAEYICEVFRSRYELDVVILRLFNVYGPGAEKKQTLPAINSLIRAVLLNIESVINGSDKIARDFIFIDDVVDAIIHATDLGNEHIPFKTMNIATGIATTLSEVMQMIANVNESQVKFQIGPLRKGDVDYSRGSIMRMNNALKYAIKINVEEGIRLTFEHMKNRFHDWA